MGRRVTWRRTRGCSFFGSGWGAGLCFCGDWEWEWRVVLKCERVERGVEVREWEWEWGSLLRRYWGVREGWLRRVVDVGDRRWGGVRSSCMSRTEEGLRNGERVLGGV